MIQMIYEQHEHPQNADALVIHQRFECSQTMFLVKCILYSLNIIAGVQSVSDDLDTFIFVVFVCTCMEWRLVN